MILPANKTNTTTPHTSITITIMSQTAQKRIQKEFMGLQKTPAIEGSKAELVGDSLSNWTVHIIGPKNTPYEKGLFKFDFNFPKEYPFHPPVVKCETKTYHCNFDEEGNICLDLLRKDGWSPMNSIKDVIVAINQLLIEPNPDHPLDASIGEMYQNNMKQYLKTAKEYTKKYAK